MIFRPLCRLARHLLFGETTRFKPWETQVLGELQKALSEHDRDALAIQITGIESMQRTNRGRRLAFTFEKPGKLPLFGNAGEERCLAEFEINGSFGAIPVSVIGHRGLLSSFEFGKSPRVIGVQPFTVRSAAMRNHSAGITLSFDGERQGRQS